MHFPILLKVDMEVANTRSSLTSKWLRSLASAFAVSLF